jgi:Lar family restriction alleviation protein
MSDDDPCPTVSKSSAALSAEAGIGRGCPFCGRREKTIRDWHFLRIADSNTTQLECLSCGARGPRCTTAKDGSDLLEALELWNERQGEGGLLQQRDRSTLQ